MELNQLLDEKDIIVSASGSMPSDLERIWSTKGPGTYHLEYGFSCMGYEIPAAMGAKIAEPDCEVYALLGDGVFTMAHSEFITSLQEKQKVNIILFDNHGHQCIHNLQRSQGIDSFATEFRYRENNLLEGEYIPIDFAKVAEGYGAAAYRVNTLEEFREAVADSKQQTKSTLIDIKVLPGTMTEGYESFWRVGTAQIAENKNVEAAAKKLEDKLKILRKENQKMKIVRIGILGAGRIGKVHAQNVLTMPDTKLVTIADPYISKKMTEWDEENCIIATKETEEVFRSPDIDAVLICSSSNTHAEFIIKAAKAGKHIFCEKPIDYDTDRIRETLEIVEKAGVKLQIGFMRRFDHNHRKVHDSVMAGVIGEPHILRISSRDPVAPPLEYVKQCGGFYYDMTIHDFDLARYLVGSEITEVYVMGAVRFNPAVAELGDIDTALVTLKFENGCFGTIDNSRETHCGYVQRNEVFGSKGSIEVFDDRPNTVRFSVSEGVSIEKPHWFFMDRYNDAFRAEIEA